LKVDKAGAPFSGIIVVASLLAVGELRKAAKSNVGVIVNREKKGVRMRSR